jgi:hypothetical protein
VTARKTPEEVEALDANAKRKLMNLRRWYDKTHPGNVERFDLKSWTRDIWQLWREPVPEPNRADRLLQRLINGVTGCDPRHEGSS